MQEMKRRPTRPLRPASTKMRKTPLSLQPVASASRVGSSLPNNNNSQPNRSGYSSIARAALEKSLCNNRPAAPRQDDELELALRYMIDIPPLMENFAPETLPEGCSEEPEEGINLPDEMIFKPQWNYVADGDISVPEEVISVPENEGSSSSGSSSSSSDGSSSSSDSDDSSSSSESEDEKKDMPAAQEPAVAMPTPTPGFQVPIIRAANSVILPSERLSDSEDEKPKDTKAAGAQVEQVWLNIAELNLSESESSNDEQEAKKAVGAQVKCFEVISKKGTVVEKVAKEEEEIKNVVSSEKKPKKLIVESGKESDPKAKNTKKQSTKEVDGRRHLKIPSLESEKKIEKFAPLSEKPKVSRARSESADEALRTNRPKRFKKKIMIKIKELFSDDSDSDYEIAERPNRVKPKSRSNVSQTNAAVGIKRKASPIKDQKLAQPEKYIKLCSVDKSLKVPTESRTDKDTNKPENKSACNVNKSFRVPSESRSDKDTNKSENKSVCSVNKSFRVPIELRTNKDTNKSENKSVCSVDKSSKVPNKSRTDKDIISNQKKSIHRSNKSSRVPKKSRDDKSDANKSDKKSTSSIDVRSSEPIKSGVGRTGLGTSEKKSVTNIDKRFRIPKKSKKENAISGTDSEHRKKPKEAEKISAPTTTAEKKSSREPKSALGYTHHPTEVRATCAPSPPSFSSSDSGSESPPLTANKKLALRRVFGCRHGGPTPRTIILDTRFTAVICNPRRLSTFD